MIRAVSLAICAAAIAWSQPPPALMTSAQVDRLCERSLQLMDAGGIAVPDLQRAAAPIIENARQACIQIKAKPGTTESTYTLLNHLRAYMSLSDAVPKPYPFPDAARQQLSELRDSTTRLEAHFRALLDQKETEIRNVDRDNLGRYAEANRRLPQANSANPRVVFLGDSITDLWRLNEYFPNNDFINRGISGQITTEMLARMKADVMDLHPAALVVLGGTNDLARGVPLTAIENNYVMIADLADADKIKVIFASVLPVSDYHKDASPANERTPAHPLVFIKALNDWLQSFCNQRKYTYLNYYSSLVDTAGQFIADMSDDGLHPNPKGYRVMAPLVLEAVQKALPRQVVAQEPSPKPLKRHSASN